MYNTQYLNYLRELSVEQETNYFTLPWSGGLIRNYHIATGELYRPKTLSEYKSNNISLWILLKTVLFRDKDGTIFGVMCCTECPSMSGILDLKNDQDKAEIMKLLCHHSKAFTFLVSDWEEKMNIEDNNDIGEFSQHFENEEIKKKIFQTKQDLLLAVYQENKQFSVLFTVSKLMKIPVCSKCSRRPCPCYIKLKETKETNTEELEEDEEQNENDKLPDKDGQKRVPIEHYENDVPMQEWYHNYGSNTTKIIYPFKRDLDRRQLLINRLRGEEPFTSESKIVAEYKPGHVCELHGNLFSSSDKLLVKTSDKIIVYSESFEKVYNIETYGRGTGCCKCVQQLDGDKFGDKIHLCKTLC